MCVSVFSSYRVGSQHLQVWLSRLQQLGHHVQETLHEGFDALRVTRHQQLVQSLHGYHHIPAHSNKLYTHDTGAFQHLQVYRNTTPDVCHRGRGLSRDTQTLPNPLPPNVLTEQFFEALLYLKTEAAKGGDERLVLNRGRCSRCVSIKIHKKSGSLSGWKCLCTEHIIAWCNFTAAPPGRRRLTLQTRACKHVTLLGDERSGKGAWMPCRR